MNKLCTFLILAFAFSTIQQGTKAAINTAKYNSFADIKTWLVEEVGKAETNAVAYVNEIGKSTDLNEIFEVEISTGPDAKGKTKPIIYIDANIHANEWISSAVAVYIINELTFNTANYTAILSKFDFRIVPVLNPDGYIFTHAPDGDRSWRKTRSITVNTACIGVDPNRNFPYFFGGENTSTEPCANNYRGSTALSEPETAALSTQLQSLIGNENGIFAYITLHACGSLWLLSWGYTANAFPKEYKELERWGRLSTEAINSVHGQNYTYGQAAELLYGVGGASDDYAKNLGAKYAATVELRCGGSHGYDLPEDQIIPTAEEVWKGIQVLETMDDSSLNSGVGFARIQNLFIFVPLVVLRHFF